MEITHKNQILDDVPVAFGEFGGCFLDGILNPVQIRTCKWYVLMISNCQMMCKTFFFCGLRTCKVQYAMQT